MMECTEERVASWVVKEKKKILFCSLVGFSASKSRGLRQAGQWLDHVWGKMQMLDELVVWIQFQSEAEVEEVLMAAKDQDINSPFTID